MKNFLIFLLFIWALSAEMTIKSQNSLLDDYEKTSMECVELCKEAIKQRNDWMDDCLSTKKDSL